LNIFDFVVSNIICLFFFHSRCKIILPLNVISTNRLKLKQKKLPNECRVLYYYDFVSLRFIKEFLNNNNGSGLSTLQLSHPKDAFVLYSS
jgi:hypothetical protein